MMAGAADENAPHEVIFFGFLDRAAFRALDFHGGT
jgi:hypothetical protein